MSGTSADGIDAALVETNGESAPRLIASLEQPHPPALRQRILALYHSGPDELERLGALDRELGERFAAAAVDLCEQAGFPLDQVDLIGSHGQTVRHAPPRFTLQIGNPFVIAAITGITTIADFRPADVARGGQGAPLTPLFHQHLFQTPGHNVAVVNLGGIANITALSADPATPVRGGDTGPANTLLDLLAQHLLDAPCDHDGALAATGMVQDTALAWLLAHPYLAQPFPKSTGREVFGEAYLHAWLAAFPDMTPADRFSTLTQFTVTTVARACRELLPPQRVVVCGGGTRNPEIMTRLQHALPEARVETSAVHGVDAASLEAQAFAWFAARTWHGLPSSLPRATGARAAAVLGSICPGGNWGRLQSV